jgi:coenzyme F420-0:L-glutamate ligase / coenzyme F420-1:gamma-L-glutamate ligase
VAESLSARAVSGLPEIRAGDDLAALIVAALGDERLRAGQVVVIAHKAVSKAEGSVVALADVQPGARARELAAGTAAEGHTARRAGSGTRPGGPDRAVRPSGQGRAVGPGGQGRDPRVVQVVLDESAEILRAERGVLVCRTHHGFVCANAGVDASNASSPDTLILLPRDPDASARGLRARLRELTRSDGFDPVAPAVLITDSFGRAWRHGQLDVAIGLAGMRPLDDWRGRPDATGLELQATWLAIADAAAATADLARAKDSREPVVVIDGLERFVTAEDGPGASALLRPPDEDLFR